MVRKTLVSSLALGALVVLAFGSTDLGSGMDLDDLENRADETLDLGAGAGGDASANKAACEAYIAKYNELPCMSAVQLDPANYCKGAAANTMLDMTDYYDCMAENAKCNGQIPDLAGQAGCQDKL